jgi:hypothetical protein
MPSTTKSPNAAAAEQRALVRSLCQSVAAELIGRPSVWLRDNGHKSGRNADGSYNAVELVANILKAQPVASLSDEQLEGVTQVVETVYADGERHWLALADLEAVEARFGTAGLAAIGAELLKHVRKWAEVEPYRPEHYTEQQVGTTAGRPNRWLFTCEYCGRYRLGDKWKQPPLPYGYVAHTVTRECDKCRR